jgi:iron complex transport system ATP-binding protein
MNLIKLMTDEPLFTVQHLNIHTLTQPQHCLVKQLSFKVHAGERWVILGANGCGKSSILQATAGLPLAGRAVDYASIHIMGHHYTPRTAGIKAFTALRNYCPQRLDWSAYLTVLQLADLLNINPCLNENGFLNRLPQSWLSQPLSRRSGGEQQRIALSLTLAQAAQLIFLDEPLNHLDEVQQLQHLAVLKHSGKTLIMVSHHIKLSLNFSTHVLMPSTIDAQGNQQWVAGACRDIITPQSLAAAYNIDTALAAQLLVGTEYGV